MYFSYILNARSAVGGIATCYVHPTQVLSSDFPLVRPTRPSITPGGGGGGVNWYQTYLGMSNHLVLQVADVGYGEAHHARIRSLNVINL